MTIETRKYHLIEQIMKISNDHLLGQLEKVLDEFLEGGKSVSHLVKPMRKKLEIEELIQEQEFKGSDKEVIDHLIEEAAIEEPIEELLEML